MGHDEADGAPEAPSVTVTLLGRVKAGKSSVINALLGERRAQTDVLPATATVQRYELHTPDTPFLTFLDTVGYAHTGAKADQVAATGAAAQASDVLFVVVHARDPGRQADITFLDDLRAWFAARPDLKPPPLIAVLTHVDLLFPALEWAPPYDWHRGSRPKEQNIREAVAAARAQLGERVADVVPVCTRAGQVWGVEEALLPAILGRLDEAHGVALLRCLKGEKDTGKVRKIFWQLLAVGKEAARIAWEQYTKPRPAAGPPAPGERTP
jgi:predicted GTPase